MYQSVNIQLLYLVLFLIPYLIGGFIYSRSGNIWKTSMIFATCQLLTVYTLFYHHAGLLM